MTTFMNRTIFKAVPSCVIECSFNGSSVYFMTMALESPWDALGAASRRAMQ